MKDRLTLIKLAEVKVLAVLALDSPFPPTPTQDLLTNANYFLKLFPQTSGFTANDGTQNDLT